MGESCRTSKEQTKFQVRNGNGSFPFLAYLPEVRKMSYTTPAIERLHMQLRTIVQNRGHFPNDQAARKGWFLALQHTEKVWKMPPVTWKNRPLTRLPSYSVNDSSMP